MSLGAGILLLLFATEPLATFSGNHGEEENKKNGESDREFRNRRGGRQPLSSPAGLQAR